MSEFPRADTEVRTYDVTTTFHAGEASVRDKALHVVTPELVAAVEKDELDEED